MTTVHDIIYRNAFDFRHFVRITYTSLQVYESLNYIFHQDRMQELGFYDVYAVTLFFG